MKKILRFLRDCYIEMLAWVITIIVIVLGVVCYLGPLWVSIAFNSWWWLAFYLITLPLVKYMSEGTIFEWYDK